MAYPTVAIINLETAEAVSLTDNIIVNQADTTRKTTLSSVLSSLGLMRCIFFSEGGVLESRKDVAFYEEAGVFYTWNGAYPKFIEAGSTPETTGGLSQSGFTPFSQGSSGVGGGKIYNLGSAGPSLVLDLSRANIFTLTLTKPITTLAISGVSSDTGYAQECSLVITQGTEEGGDITWPDNIYWQDSNTPALSPQGFVDIVNLITFDNGRTWVGSFSSTSSSTGSTPKEITGSFSVGSHGFIRLSSPNSVNVGTISTSKPEGFELTLMVARGSENMITLKKDIGNMLLNGDFTFESTTSLIRLLYTQGSWVELFRSGR